MNLESVLVCLYVFICDFFKAMKIILKNIINNFNYLILLIFICNHLIKNLTQINIKKKKKKENLDRLYISELSNAFALKYI